MKAFTSHWFQISHWICREPIKNLKIVTLHFHPSIGKMIFFITFTDLGMEKNQLLQCIDNYPLSPEQMFKFLATVNNQCEILTGNVFSNLFQSFSNFHNVFPNTLKHDDLVLGPIDSSPSESVLSTQRLTINESGFYFYFCICYCCYLFCYTLFSFSFMKWYLIF